MVQDCVDLSRKYSQAAADLLCELCRGLYIIIAICAITNMAFRWFLTVPVKQENNHCYESTEHE